MGVQKFIVSRDDTIYQAWPDVVLTDEGKLICVFTECEHHNCRDRSRIMLCESMDRGRTWSEKRPLSERGDRTQYYNNSRITKLADGSLIIVCDKIWNGETRYAEVHLWHGDAAGKHFEGPVITPARGIVPDKLLEQKNGRWLLAAHFGNKKTDKLEQYVWYSDDKGKTWSERITVGADVRYNLCEASILPLSDGTLVAFMRENSFQGYDCFKSFSYDNGETWDGVYHVPIPGCHRPVSGFLQNGSIMLTHRYLQGGQAKMFRTHQNAFAAFMDLETVQAKERSQQWVRLFPLDYDRSPYPDTGYTGWVQFDDGEIYIVNYIVDDAPKGQIRGYSFTMDDVVLK